LNPKVLLIISHHRLKLERKSHEIHIIFLVKRVYCFVGVSKNVKNVPPLPLLYGNYRVYVPTHLPNIPTSYQKNIFTKINRKDDGKKYRDSLKMS
jgi:hypothetical protein